MFIDPHIAKVVIGFFAIIIFMAYFNDLVTHIRGKIYRFFSSFNKENEKRKYSVNKQLIQSGGRMEINISELRQNNPQLSEDTIRIIKEVFEITKASVNKAFADPFTYIIDKEHPWNEELMGAREIPRYSGVFLRGRIPDSYYYAIQDQLFAMVWIMVLVRHLNPGDLKKIRINILIDNEIGQSGIFFTVPEYDLEAGHCVNELKASVLTSSRKKTLTGNIEDALKALSEVIQDVYDDQLSGGLKNLLLDLNLKSIGG